MFLATASVCVVSLKETNATIFQCSAQQKMWSVHHLFSILLCLPGLAGQCRARRGHLVVVAAAVCM